MSCVLRRFFRVCSSSPRIPVNSSKVRNSTDTWFIPRSFSLFSTMSDTVASLQTDQTLGENSSNESVSSKTSPQLADNKTGDPTNVDLSKQDSAKDISLPKEESVDSKPDNRFSKTVVNFNRKRKDKKYALLIGYSGEGYCGMQWNPEVPTIEDKLLTAFAELDLIPSNWKSDIQSLEFQRCARTDKGVSAAGQVVSVPLPECDDAVLGKINSLLPDSIRVFGYRKTTRGFNSKTWCSARTYLYTIPTFAFAPMEDTITYDYRLQTERIEKVRELLKRFHGTNNYHNYTIGVKAWQDAAKRHMKEVSCGDPFVCDGMELVTIKIRGQSFMMHQIRKMVGMVISIMRGHVAEELFDATFGPQKFDIPRAPGLGLMLEQVHFDQYNQKFGNDGIHERLEWPECKDQIEKLKMDYIFPSLVRGEKEENSSLTWVSHLHMHVFGLREFNPETAQSVRNPNTHSPLGNAWYSAAADKLEKEVSGDEAGSDTETPPKKKVKSDKIDIF